MKGSEIRIRKVTAEDKDNVLGLLNSVFSEQQRSNFVRGAEYWDWKFYGSIFGNSILTVAESGNSIVGFDHLWPWSFVKHAHTFNAVQPCDTVVHPDYTERIVQNNEKVWIKRSRDERIPDGD